MLKPTRQRISTASLLLAGLLLLPAFHPGRAQAAAACAAIKNRDLHATHTAHFIAKAAGPNLTPAKQAAFDQGAAKLAPGQTVFLLDVTGADKGVAVIQKAKGRFYCGIAADEATARKRLLQQSAYRLHAHEVEGKEEVVPF